MEGNMEKDIIIIGGGPAGYTAAIRAAQLGAGVTLIEEDKLGGTCLNRGCIPTKALYRNAQLLHDLSRSEEFGIQLGRVSIDLRKILGRKQEIVDRLKSGISQLLKANSIELLSGKGRPVGEDTVEVLTPDARTIVLKARHILIATGSRSTCLPIPGMDLPGVMTSDELLTLENIPKTLVVVGGGVIGIEFAGIFNALGSQVTVLEFLPRILPAQDSEISRKIALSLKKKGITIENEVCVKKVVPAEKGLLVFSEGKKGELALPAEAVLVSTGRSPNTDGLNLDSLGIAYDARGIKVNENYQTSLPHIYAAGDVTGGQMLAHVAAEEGKAAVEGIMGLRGHVNYDAVPSCIFSFPEIASVGLTPEAADGLGISYTTGKFLFGANGKALTLGEEEGFVKVLAENGTGKVLGVHIMGPHASDLIHEAVLAIENHLTASDIIRTIHAHPTLSEAFAEAVMGVESRAIHMAPAKTKRQREI